MLCMPLIWRPSRRRDSATNMGMVENFKDVISIVQKLDNIELYRKILDLQAEALRLSGDLITKDQELRSKERRITELEELTRFQATVVIADNGFYFDRDQSGRPMGHPYCPKCWEVNRVPVHIHQMGSSVVERNKSVCPNCKSTYKYIPRKGEN
jgi:hypothetical protein